LLGRANSPQQKGVEIGLKDLKALFFVKDFRGDSRYKESKKVGDGKPGRKVEVTFFDGEKNCGHNPGIQSYAQRLFCIPRGCQEQ